MAPRFGGIILAFIAVIPAVSLTFAGKTAKMPSPASFKTPHIAV
jgi:hypothetical protein